jgi:hypothetical protein
MTSWKTRRPTHLFVTLLTVALASTTLAEQPAGVLRTGVTLQPREFGVVDSSILNIPAAAFVPRSSIVEWAVGFPGYLYSTNAFQTIFWAPVNLPTGAHVTDMILYYDDTAVSDDITATLRTYSGFTDGNVAATDIASVSSSGSGGKNIASTSVDHTVRNDNIFDNGMYVIDIFTGTFGSSLKFKGVDLRWNRQVSAAPLNPTFDDVPTDDFGFAYIEALSASGITSGCNAAPPQFCPDRQITRREMAIFLAKALGLHWPR